MRNLFVKMKDRNTVLRHVGNGRYYVDGGDWGVGSKTENGKLISVSTMSHINGIALDPATYEDYQKANGDYAVTIEHAEKEEY